jgi:hypothetical protein
MLWTLALAHLLGDYPLQTNRMVELKRTWSGLSLHVVIHFVTMLVVVWPASGTLWPYLLALAGLHFVIDLLKNVLSVRQPRWIIRSYLGDQVLHLLSIWMIATWIEGAVPSASPLLPVTVTIYLIGYLLVTYVWSISERVLVHMNPAYQAAVESLFWLRMSLRAGLLTLLLLVTNLTGIPTSAPSMGILYLTSHYGRRALVTDVVVTFVVVLFLLLVGI